MALHFQNASVADKWADLVNRNMRVKALPLAPLSKAHVAQSGRGSTSRACPVQVRVPPWVPVSWGIGLKEEHLSYKEEAAERYRHPLFHLAFRI